MFLSIRRLKFWNITMKLELDYKQFYAILLKIDKTLWNEYEYSVVSLKHDKINGLERA